MELLPLVLLSLVVTLEAYPLQDSTLDLNEIVWSPELQKVYIGSPSLVRLPSGTLLASSDRFEHGPSPACWKPHSLSQRRRPRRESVNRSLLAHGSSVSFASVYLYRSRDNGTNWAFVTTVPQQYWSNLFVLKDSVYLMGTAGGDNAIRISQSVDEGTTWKGSTLFANGKWGTGPTPTLKASDGRLYRALELNHTHAQLFWADSSAPLLDPSSWSHSNAVPFNKSWWSFGDASYIEGNAVEGPDGEIYNVLRIDALPHANYAAFLRLDKATSTLKFVGIHPFPGGSTKFTIRFDPVTKLYLTLSNNVTDFTCPSMRCVLTLAQSADLFNWTAVKVVLADDTGMEWADVMRYVGFQYVDWQLVDDDMWFVVRTAYRGAYSYHNANRLTFKKLKNFRRFLRLP